MRNDQGLVLIDTGYYMFNRYFATLKWYRIVKKESVDVAHLHENEEFVNAFKGHVLGDIMKLAMYPYITKKYGPRLPQKNKKIRNKVIFCLDCPRAKIWRMTKYPQYKGTRKQAVDMNINIVGIFHAYVDGLIGGTEAFPPQFPDAGKEMGLAKISMDGLEADDIVYLMLKRLRTEGYATPVLVMTNDNDFMQMVPMDAIVVNAKGVHLVERVNHDPTTSTMIKVLTGDVSDNIKPVPCIGANPNTALSVANMNEKSRLAWIKEHGGVPCTKAYTLNKKLILLNLIPQPLAQNFHASLVVKVI